VSIEKNQTDSHFPLPTLYHKVCFKATNKNNKSHALFNKNKSQRAAKSDSKINLSNLLRIWRNFNIKIQQQEEQEYS